MTTSARTFKVFVSSTSEDLKNYRAVVKDVIIELGWQPAMMEHFGSQPGYTIDYCRETVEQCDLVLLIVAGRLGWVPTVEQGGNGQDSITALELAHARSKNIPVLGLLADKSWPNDLWDDDQRPVKAFRDGINQVLAFFKHEEDPLTPIFRAIASQVLVKYKEKTLANQGRGGSAPTLDFFSTAQEGLLEGEHIPVLGCGIYGDGPLSSQALAKALLKRGAGEPTEGSRALGMLSLATAAEYRERLDWKRRPFLKRFRRIVEQHSAETKVPPVIELLAGIASLRLIVSTTYDWLLEEALARAGRKYAVVCHVLRSEGEKNVGAKVAIWRPGCAVEFCAANQLQVARDECIVYKPLGSPLVEAPDPECEIDTVVVTESDHACFLQRLESPETGVPGCIQRCFKRDSLLFLGYTMDVWQYRLAMLVFETSGRDSSKALTMAVRVADDEIEALAWDRLHARLIPMDTDEFARSAGAMAGSAR